ncbi:MAG TPA: ferrochelatase, partial [Jatrophihabitans sp.]|uniref:ferrochelatase n=1 Tax=Jatrophihabitans sp. TaxID=1932789 RepID=UPI002E0630D8|nr:ferrochelatase [Jatrophihabitans sp.]
MPYAADALLLLSFGGPEGPDDVMPFLRNVTRGRGIPDERLAEVAEHYQHFHGVSPINEQNRDLIAALEVEFRERGIDLPIYWGNRNWKPYVADAVRQMRDDGVQRALVFATSATASYSSCRQYREDLAQAQRVSGEGAPELVKLRHFFDHPGFVEAAATGVRAALDELPAEHRDTARLIFTAHSVPVSMNEQSGPRRNGLYEAQQRETARLVAESIRGAGAEFDLVWQSRSGPPQIPWLEPDINDHLRDLAGQGVRAVVVAPTGFVSDHIEVRWDLDTEARDTAAELGLAYARAQTAGTHPAFVSAVRELVQERTDDAEPKFLGKLGLGG